MSSGDEDLSAVLDRAERIRCEAFQRELAEHMELWGIRRVLPPGFALQGEIVGEEIQGNRLKLKGRNLYVFNAYDIAKAEYLPTTDFMFKYIAPKTVPVICAIPLPSSVQEIIDMAGGASALNPSVPREGLVFRPIAEQREMIRGEDRRLSFKAISNQYLLKDKK